MVTDFTSPLVSNSVPEVSVTAGSAAFATERSARIGPMIPNVLNWVGCPSHTCSGAEAR